MSKLIDSRLIGQSIKQLRLSKNWTQDYLAGIVGYSVRNLRRIENDGTSSIDVVNTFADIFQVSAISILNGVLFFFINKKRHCRPSPYNTYPHLLFIHMHSRLSMGCDPSASRMGYC